MSRFSRGNVAKHMGRLSLSCAQSTSLPLGQCPSLALFVILVNQLVFVSVCIYVKQGYFPILPEHYKDDKNRLGAWKGTNFMSNRA